MRCCEESPRRPVIPAQPPDCQPSRLCMDSFTPRLSRVPAVYLELAF